MLRLRRGSCSVDRPVGIRVTGTVLRIADRPYEKREPAPAPGSAADAELIAAVARGDEQALSLLYDRLAPRAFAIALRIARDEGLAEEIVAEAFVRLWRRAEGFTPTRGAASAWFGEIVRNCAFDELRRRRRRPPEVDLAAAALSADEMPDTADQMAIRDAVAALPPRQRAVLELAYFAGLTQREIAQRTGMPLGTVKSHTWRGLETLRRTLDRE